MSTTAKLSDLDQAFASDSGVGFEEVTSSDLQIPFIRIIQALSPQLKKSDAAYLQGASQGDIFNTVTGQFWEADKGLSVLPVYYQTKYLEFVPRSHGGARQGLWHGRSCEWQRTGPHGAAFR